ncbi:MAG TPA: hypothetical protein VLN26_05560 [Gaiellaceae bacterium]|nr:hypothetical protein [Gaiellaceae bacterium]
MDREERFARNEALFREVNERLEELGRRTGTAEGGVDFVCECADESCTERIQLSLREYEDVRADPRQFAVLPGHQVFVEHVVADRGGYLIVAKDGEAGALAEDTDPRS